MLTFTDRAREMIRSYIDGSDGELGALRVHMVGSPLSPSFELTLVSDDERRADEREFDTGDFTVLVADDEVQRLDGATVDFVERVNESGFEVRAHPSPSGAVSQSRSAPEGPLAARVRELLDQQVNPAIASHGGEITLVDIQGTEVYLEMSGGCQGCAMSRMTLRQGVERMLREAVPELTAVHDVTDHASGTDPYYQQLG
jgi:Fe/S biogenesis protein NfuA